MHHSPHRNSARAVSSPSSAEYWPRRKRHTRQPPGALRAAPRPRPPATWTGRRLPRHCCLLRILVISFRLLYGRHTLRQGCERGGLYRRQARPSARDGRVESSCGGGQSGVRQRDISSAGIPPPPHRTQKSRKKACTRYSPATAVSLTGHCWIKSHAARPELEQRSSAACFQVFNFVWRQLPTPIQARAHALDGRPDWRTCPSLPRPGTCLRPPRRSQAPPAAAHAFLRGPATPPGKRPACYRTCCGPPPMLSATAPPPHPLRRRGARATTPTFQPSCAGTYPALGRQRYRGGEAGPIACGGRRLPPGRSRAGVEEINFWLIPRLSGPSHEHSDDKLHSCPIVRNGIQMLALLGTPIAGTLTA